MQGPRRPGERELQDGGAVRVPPLRAAVRDVRSFVHERGANTRLRRRDTEAHGDRRARDGEGVRVDAEEDGGQGGEGVPRLRSEEAPGAANGHVALTLDKRRRRPPKTERLEKKATFRMYLSERRRGW